MNQLDDEVISADSLLDAIGLDIKVWAAARLRRVSILFFIKLLLIEPGFQMVFIFRLREACAGIPVLGSMFRRLAWYFSTVFFSSDLGVDLKAAGGLYFPHPFGIVINGQCRIGRNVTILQGVTLGVLDDPLGAPQIRAGGYLGAGATVLGNSVVGAGARVGAGAVVLCDVPAGRTAVGVPARII